MSDRSTFEIIPVGMLLERVGSLHKQNCRLVQIGATRLPEQIELNYSFEREGKLVNLRLQLPPENTRIPSISSIYWCAFIYENEIHDLFKIDVDGMAVDFKGNFYQTAVKYPFGSTKAPVAKPATAAPQPGATAKPATSPAQSSPVAGTTTAQ